MVLAEKIGRGAAYDLMKALLKDADGSKDLLQCVLESRAVRAALTEDEIVAACDPLSYLGCNDALIEETVAAFDDYIDARTA